MFVCSVHALVPNNMYIELLPLFHLSDPIAFIDIVGKEEDAEKEEDMKTSKMNEREAQTVVSATILHQSYTYVCTEDRMN